MAIFLINGERVEAGDEYQARIKYSQGVEVVRETPLPETVIPHNIQRLVIPKWVKKEIVEQKQLHHFEKPFIIIRGEPFNFLEVDSFETQREMDLHIQEEYVGEDFSPKYIIKKGKTYEVIIDMKLTYVQIKKIPKAEE
jgi:hypothetical protein